MSDSSDTGSDSEFGDGPIVIDNGSYSVKCGFAGDDAPISCLRTPLKSQSCHLECDRPSVQRLYFLDDWACLGDQYRAIAEGVVQDWDCIEALWEHFLLSKEVVCADNSIIMLSAIRNNTPRNIDKFCEIVLEKFGFEKLCLAIPETMALFSNGICTGVVTNIGYDSCVSVPIIEGKRGTHEVCPIKVGGQHVSNYIHNELTNTYGVQDLHEATVYDIMRLHCYVSDYGGDDLNTSCDDVRYVLPDDTPITLSSVLRNSTELLFKSDESCNRLADVLCHSVLRSDCCYRHRMWDNMVVHGRTSLLKGLPERLTMEVRLQSDPGARFRTIAPPERGYSAWIGASVFGSLSMFEDTGWTKLQYEENGTNGIEIY